MTVSPHLTLPRSSPPGLPSESINPFSLFRKHRHLKNNNKNKIKPNQTWIGQNKQTDERQMLEIRIPATQKEAGRPKAKMIFRVFWGTEKSRASRTRLGWEWGFGRWWGCGELKTFGAGHIRLGLSVPYLRFEDKKLLILSFPTRKWGGKHVWVWQRKIR